jgi:radical SAM superfamily enzyme YgiQ (UPF0313 family)
MDIKKIKVLLLHPRAPVSFHGGQYAYPALGIRANVPPLGLLTLAALFPANYVCRLVDMNVQKLKNADLDWADVILISGMVAQRKTIAEAIERIRARPIQKPIIVGGPFATAMSDAPELARVNAIFKGEAEGLEAFSAMLSDLEVGSLKRIYCVKDFPGMHLSPTPKYDLIPKLSAYFGLAMQWSRGCPFSCDFCSVSELNGKSRYKSRQQITAELDAILAIGFRGTVFISDDNLTGNRKKIRTLLVAVRDWQVAHRDQDGDLLVFYTQVDATLAEDDEIMDLMLAAGIRSIFVGLETPSENALRESGKKQNLGRDLADACRIFREKGFWVQAGYMIGFQTDGKESFAAMRAFVEATGVPEALVGLVAAPVGTRLWHELRGKGLIRSSWNGESLTGTNIMPREMTYSELLANYLELLVWFYKPGRYFGRASRGLKQLNRSEPRQTTWRDYRAFAWSVIWQGIFSSYALRYWFFLIRHMKKGKFGLAVGLAVRLHHFRRLLKRNVAPALLAQIET